MGMNTITPNSNINFSARYVNSATVKKLDKAARDYVNRSAYMLEFDPASKKDLDAVVKIAERWNGARFGDDIATTANKLYYSKENPHQERIFLFTTQNSNYAVPDVKQILGVAQTSCDDGYSICVDYIQTKPSLMNKPDKSPKQKDFKHVGVGMLDSLKKKFADKPVYLYPLPDVVKFYENNGFKEISKNPTKYKWTKQG